MRTILTALTLLLTIGCENNITGVDHRRYIEDVSFTVEETSVGAWFWNVNGTITNTSNEKIRRIWYISADFYTDSTFSTFCSNTYSKMNINLNPGETINWSMCTPGGNCRYERNDYPNFVVTNITLFK